MNGVPLLLIALGVSVFVASARAEGNSIRGTVSDARGKPVAGAEIRAESIDGKAPAAVAITNAKGEYVLNHLSTGSYKVVASVYKTPRSIARVTTSRAGWVKVDFPLRDSFARPLHRDQSQIDRIQGQDLRRMMQDQPLGH